MTNAKNNLLKSVDCSAPTIGKVVHLLSGIFLLCLDDVLPRIARRPTMPFCPICESADNDLDSHKDAYPHKL